MDECVRRLVLYPYVGRAAMSCIIVRIVLAHYSGLTLSTNDAISNTTILDSCTVELVKDTHSI